MRIGLGLSLASRSLLPPLTLTASAGTGVPGDAITLTAAGGLAPYTYSIQTNASLGVLASSTWKAGLLSGTDVLLVTDALGHTATVNVVVTGLSTLNSLFDARVGVTLNGSNVSAIADQSGAGVQSTLQQTTSADQPPFVSSGINSLADINFNGATGLAGTTTLLASTGITLFSVFKHTSTSGLYMWGMQFNAFHYMLASNYPAGSGGGGAGHLDFVMSSNQHAKSDGTVNDGNPHVAIATWSTSDNTGRLYIDGTLQTVTLTSTSIPAAAGDVNSVGTQANGQGVISGPYNGHLATWGSCSSCVTGAELTKLTNALKARAGL